MLFLIFLLCQLVQGIYLLLNRFDLLIAPFFPILFGFFQPFGLDALLLGIAIAQRLDDAICNAVNPGYTVFTDLLLNIVELFFQIDARLCSFFIIGKHEGELLLLLF